MKRSRKIPDVFKTKSRKKLRLAPPGDDVGGHSWNEPDIRLSDIPSDTKAALLYLRSLINVQVFNNRVPPIVFKKQIYSIVKLKTTVDMQINDLREKKEIKLFRLGREVDAFAIVFTDDYSNHVKKTMADSPAKDKFLDIVLQKTSDVSLGKKTMTELGFSDDEITQLIQGGVLNVRDVGSWWIAIPGASIFLKSFNKGRDGVLRTIRKCKYQKILKEDLLERKLAGVKALGMQYHIHDIIGAEFVEVQDTTSGPMIMLDE